MIKQRQDDRSQDDASVMAPAGARRQRTLRRRMLIAARYGWPALVALGALWFPFDWLSVVWPPFGVPFRMVFHSAHDHFIGHTVFFLIVGLLLAYLPPVRRRPLWYLLGLALAALIQEAIQALFRGQAPTFTDFNAFSGDALGGVGALALWSLFRLILGVRKRRMAPQSPITPASASNRERD
ncbi:MAG TPA: hypothetical protein VFQ25_07125 [Ktedonobacterales bacterium]|nr:hypothetical protein [Ktedonobacterales bacterium]